MLICRISVIEYAHVFSVFKGLYEHIVVRFLYPFPFSFSYYELYFKNQYFSTAGIKFYDDSFGVFTEITCKRRMAWKKCSVLDRGIG